MSPAGGAGAEGLSREAEGQQGTEQLPVMEKFTSVGRNSLDIFSPAREGPFKHYCLIVISFSNITLIKLKTVIKEWDSVSTHIMMTGGGVCQSYLMRLSFKLTLIPRLSVPDLKTPGTVGDSLFGKTHGTTESPLSVWQMLLWMNLLVPD